MKNKRGRPRSAPGHKLVRVPLFLCENDKNKLHEHVPQSARAAFVRFAVADKIAAECDAPITQEWLTSVGFTGTYINPKLGIYRYYLPMPKLKDVGVLVAFGDNQGAWLCLRNESVILESVKSQRSLRQFIQLTAGRSIEDCAAIAKQEGK